VSSGVTCNINFVRVHGIGVGSEEQIKREMRKLGVKEDKRRVMG
jgi:hypothetical protein